MESPKSHLAVSELNFSLFQRPLHPELFTIHARRHIKTERYEATIWATGGSHVVSLSEGDVCLTELISTPGQLLPKRGLIERFQFRGQRSHKCTLSRGLSYMTDFQVARVITIWNDSQKIAASLSRSRIWRSVGWSRLATSILKHAGMNCIFIHSMRSQIR